MTDIYVSSKRSRGGCLPALVFAALLLGGAVFFLRDSLPGQRTSAPNEPSVTDTSPTTEPVNAATWSSRLQEVENEIQAGRLQPAREQLQAWQSGTPPPVVKQQLEFLLGKVHTQQILTQAPMKEKQDHVITRGDTLGKLAQSHGTTVELIKTSNLIQGNLIRLGDRIRIFSGGTFRVEVDKSDNVLLVFLNDTFFKRYQVGTGKYNRTPIGSYKITLRQKDPIWYRPDGIEIPYGAPENLLGTHYLKLDTPGIGLHGTWEEETIGSQSSAGCVRLLNTDIEELYTILPVGTVVEIVD